MKNQLTDFKSICLVLENLIDLCNHQADFRNGVTDSTGTIDEGNVIAAQVMQQAGEALDKLKEMKINIDIERDVLKSMGDASTRKDEGHTSRHDGVHTSPAQPSDAPDICPYGHNNPHCNPNYKLSEIPVDENKLADDITRLVRLENGKGFCPGVTSNDAGKKIIEEIRPYLRTTAPVSSVDIEKRIYDVIEEKMAEFGDNPAECLAIIGEYIGLTRHFQLHGMRGDHVD